MFNDLIDWSFVCFLVYLFFRLFSFLRWAFHASMTERGSDQPCVASSSYEYASLMNMHLLCTVWFNVITRDQPNSRKKIHDFTAEFLKCVKFHGKFTERVFHVPHRRYFKVLRYCKRRNFRTRNIYYTKSRLKTVMPTTYC